MGRIIKIPAKSISYGDKRKKKAIKYIVIHYTGNKGDTAKNNGYYFRDYNTRQAGAHFFVDKGGVIVKSVNMNRTAWSVGGYFTNKDGAGWLYQKCTNYNSVSIELCDCIEGTNEAQEEAVKWLITYIRKKCPNADRVVRHWDVNGKDCPHPFVGTGNKKWIAFKKVVEA